MTASHRAIGSVLPLPDAAAALPSPHSLWTRWTGGRRYSAAYGSARSAMAAVLRFRGARRVWLPAYACPAMADAAAGFERSWYDVDAALEPDLDALSARLRPGDAVVAIAYFGRPCPAELRALAASRPDVLWIEDRAQALEPESPAWADVAVYSPRKLIGVGDGGVLASDAPLPGPAFAGEARSAAQAARRDDPDGLRPELWFQLFQGQEAAFQVDQAAISDQTRQVLNAIDPAPMAARRMDNAALLHAHLGDLTLWPEPPTSPPLATPVRLARRDAVASALASQGIYCARHWPQLPSDAGAFPFAHRLAGELLSLPCDDRYDAADMLRLVAALRTLQAEGAR